MLAAVLAVTALATWACSRQVNLVQLVPETREGMFYLNFAEAREVAQREDKHILLDFWRPG
jgi:hypothetical protein